MCICQQNLRYYRDDTLLHSVNTTFLTAGAITGALLVVLLLLLDIDGVLGDKLLRWLPGLLMAEAGVALALANADTMTAFAAIAGVAASLGAMAVFTHLLRIKVGQRLAAIGLGLALGGAIRLLTASLTAHSSRLGLVLVALAVGAIAAVTVHTRGEQRHEGVLVALAEAPPRTIISKVPYVYIVLPILAGAFWLAHTHIQRFAEGRLPSGYEGYDTAAYLGFIAAALIAALFVKMTRLALLFSLGTGIAAAAGMLAALPYLTDREAGIFALMSFASLACTRVCIYLFIIVFSLDRPHPLFYAMFGYTVATAAELGGLWLDGGIHSLKLRSYIIILLALMPVGGALLSRGMKKYGFSQEKLDHHHMVRGLIRKSCAEHEFSEREQYMIEAIVLEGSGVEELAGHFLFSNNTVKVLLRPIFRTLNVSNTDELRQYFGQAADSQEQFLAQVQAAELEKRAADKIKRREQREQERRERERLDQEEFERKLLEMQTMEQLLTVGGEDEEIDLAEADKAIEEIVAAPNPDLEDEEAEDSPAAEAGQHSGESISSGDETAPQDAADNIPDAEYIDETADDAADTEPSLSHEEAADSADSAAGTDSPEEIADPEDDYDDSEDDYADSEDDYGDSEDDSDDSEDDYTDSEDDYDDSEDDYTDSKDDYADSEDDYDDSEDDYDDSEDDYDDSEDDYADSEDDYDESEEADNTDYGYGFFEDDDEEYGDEVCFSLDDDSDEEDG